MFIFFVLFCYHELVQTIGEDEGKLDLKTCNIFKEITVRAKN